MGGGRGEFQNIKARLDHFNAGVNALSRLSRKKNKKKRGTVLATAELGRDPVIKHQIQLEYGDEEADAGRLPNPSREIKFSGANADREDFIFPQVQLTTSRIGNLTRLILTLAICDDHIYTHTIIFIHIYIHTVIHT